MIIVIVDYPDVVRPSMGTCIIYSCRLFMNFGMCCIQNSRCVTFPDSQPGNWTEYVCLTGLLYAFVSVV